MCIRSLSLTLYATAEVEFLSQAAVAVSLQAASEKQRGLWQFYPVFLFPPEMEEMKAGQHYAPQRICRESIFDRSCVKACCWQTETFVHMVFSVMYAFQHTWHFFKWNKKIRNYFKKINSFTNHTFDSLFIQALKGSVRWVTTRKIVVYLFQFGPESE